MLRSLSIAGSGMKIQQMQLDTIANNLSNVDTTGFKKNEVEFQDLLYQKMQVATKEKPVTIEVGTGARLSSTMVDHSQGILQPSENDYAMAIDGKGFFKVELPDGTIGYTRNGAFHLDSENVLVNSEGYKVLNSSGSEIKLPDNIKSFQVDSLGEIFVTEDGSDEADSIGKIGITTFANTSGLSKKGMSIYVPTTASGEPVDGEAGDVGFGAVRQKFLERSNVQVVDEMIKMITSQRAYEINTKMIQTSDDILQMTNNLRR